MAKDGDDIGRIIMGQILGDLNGGGGKGGGNRGGLAPPEPQGKQAEKLSRAFEILNERENFSPGDLLIAKEGHSLWKTTHDGRVLVVVDNIPNPKFGWEMHNNDEDFGVASPYSSLRYDIVLGFIDNDGNFTQHAYDSRRFKKYVPQNKIINIFGKKGEL